MPCCFFVRGLPGVGKSSIVANAEKLKVIDPDYISLKGENFTKIEIANNIYRINFREAIKSLNNGLSIYWTQVWSKNWGLKLTLKNFTEVLDDKFKFMPVVITVKTTRPFESFKRFKNRSINSSDTGYDEYYLKYVLGFEEANLLNVDTHLFINDDLTVCQKKFNETIDSYLKSH